MAGQRADDHLGGGAAEGPPPVEGQHVLALDEEGSISELRPDAAARVAEAIVDGGSSDPVNEPDGIVAARGPGKNPEAEAGHDSRRILRREGLEVVFTRGGLEFYDHREVGDPQLVVDSRGHEFRLELHEVGPADADIGHLEYTRRIGQRQAVAVDRLIVGSRDGHMDPVVPGLG